MFCKGGIVHTTMSCVKKLGDAFYQKYCFFGGGNKGGSRRQMKGSDMNFFLALKKRIHSKNKKKSKQGKKVIPLTFYFPSALSSQKVIINFCWTRKWSSLRAIFIDPKREKKLSSPKFFSFLITAELWPQESGSLPAAMMGILSRGQVQEEWKSDHWVHLQRRKF